MNKYFRSIMLLKLWDLGKIAFLVSRVKVGKFVQDKKVI